MTTVRVTRSGGFAGLTKHAEVDLDALPEAERATWQQVLTDDLPPAATGTTSAHRDAFSYHVQSDDHGLDVSVSEPDLPARSRALFQQALAEP